MAPTFRPCSTFPDLELPDVTGHLRRLSELADGDPLFLNFYRGFWAYNGYWFWGRPTAEQLRTDFRDATRALRDDWEVPA